MKKAGGSLLFSCLEGGDVRKSKGEGGEGAAADEEDGGENSLTRPKAKDADGGGKK